MFQGMEVDSSNLSMKMDGNERTRMRRKTVYAWARVRLEALGCRSTRHACSAEGPLVDDLVRLVVQQAAAARAGKVLHVPVKANQRERRKREEQERQQLQQQKQTKRNHKPGQRHR